MRFFNPQSLPPPRGFSHAAAAGGVVWVAGQISADAEGNVLHCGNIVAQFRRAMENLKLALEDAGCAPQGIVKITYFVTDVDAYKAALGPIGDAYRAVMGRHFPPATLVGVTRLFEPEALIEIECCAVQADSPERESGEGGDGQ